jgi:DNA-directed RNA polymerase beta subunit
LLFIMFLRHQKEERPLVEARHGRKRDRYSFGKIEEVLEMPNLIEIQHKSYRWFLETGLREMFDDVSPIQDFTGNLVLEFMEYSFGEPKYAVEECKDRDVTYAAPVACASASGQQGDTVKLKNKKSLWATFLL